ncbi:uncharacterized protein [Littorina saxatilis]|uniref:uncharacterized protein n=1 Tax=Littorina saxatilis TaxID=31220 RepID=UPI0038B51F91
MPTQAMMGDRKPPFPDNDSTALGGGPEFDNSASEKQGGVGHAFGALEQRFTVEPVCDASYLSDEFLEAVSMDLGGHQESGMKNRIAAVSSESLAMEENQLVPTASFSGPCGSPMESAVSPGTTTSSSASSFDVCSSSSQSPVPGDAQHLPPKPSAAVPGHVEPFPNFLRSNQHDSFNPDQQQQQQQGPEYQKVGEWMKNNTSPRQTDCTECCQLSPLFACTPRSEPLVSSPCCCNPCMCTSPLADCSSPACPADYRSQLSLLSSLCQSQQDLDPSTMAQHEQNFLLSPRPLTTMAGHHVFSQPRSEMPSPSKVCSKAYVHASEPLATWHSFSPPVSAVTPQQRYVLKRQGQFAQQGREPFEKNMSHYSRKATYGNTAPVQVSTASSKADTAPRSKPVLEKESNVFADDLYELLETLDDKPSLQGKAVLAARFDPTNTHDVAGLGQDRLAMPNNSVDSFCSQCDTAYASTNHTTQESRRRQSDSVLQCPSSVKMRMLEPRYYCTGKQVREVGSTSDLPSESPYSSSQLLARYQADGVSTQRLVSSVSFSSLESLASIDPSRIVLSQDHGHRPYRNLSVRTSATPGFPTFSFPFVYPASRSLQDGRPHGASYKPVTVKQEKTNVVTSLPAHFGVQRIDGSGSAQEAAYQTNGVGTSKGSCELPCYDNIDDHDNRSQGRNIYSIASSLRSLADVITQRSEDKTAARDRKDEDKTAARDRKDEDKTAARDRKDELVANFKNSPDGSVGVSNKGTVLHADVHTADNGGISPKPLAAPHAERSNLNTYSNSRTPTLLCHSPSPKSSVRQNGTFTGCFPQRRTPDGYSPKSRRSGPYTVQSPKDPQNEETRLLSPESSGQSSHATKGSRQGSPFTSCPRQNSTFTAQSPGPRVHARHEQDTDSMMLSAVPYSGRTQTNLTNDRQTLKSINRYFLSLENSCDKNNCDDVHGSSHHHHFNAQPASDVCQSDQCRVCNMDSHSSRSRDVNTFAICTRRFHCYWHGHNPSPFALHMTAHNQHLLASVAAALCHFSDRLSQLHRGGSDETSPSNADQVRDTSQVLLERLYQQSTAIASITKDFLLQIPEGSKLSAEDVSSLSQQCGFGSALILLGSQAFDAECQRFRELWSWTVAPTSPLFCFKVQLLALAGKLNAIGMDKMETALLCALSLISTDLSGLKDRDAIREVRASLLDALEAYISSRDQWFKVRVKRLFSVLPDVRVMSAWYCAIVSHIRLAAVKST